MIARATPRCRAAPGPARGQGFTLFELLLVIAVIAVVVSVTVANLGGRDDDRRLADEAQRFAVLVDLARDRAELAVEELGVDLEEDGYRFLVWVPERRRWIEPRDGRLRSRALPEAVRIDWQVEGRDARAAREASLRDARRARAAVGDQPDVLLLSSGETSPFVVRFEGEAGSAWEVRSDGIASPAVRAARRDGASG